MLSGIRLDARDLSIAFSTEAGFLTLKLPTINDLFLPKRSKFFDKRKKKNVMQSGNVY